MAHVLVCIRLHRRHRVCRRMDDLMVVSIFILMYLPLFIVSHRIPFYYLTKTLFLLYLALPQTRGSSYIYINHLQPFFHSHETQIDAALASLKSRVYTFVQQRVRQLWEHLSSTLGQPGDPITRNMPAGAPPAPVEHQGWSPTQLASSLWRSYGPSIVASGTAFLANNQTPSTHRDRPTMMGNPSSTQSVLERRRQLEAELAALSREGDTSFPASIPMPTASPYIHPSQSSTDSDMRLRDRTTSVTGRYEEIEMPSDVEGYDVGDTHRRPAATQRRTSWFGWGGGSPSGYERVKSE